MSQVLDTDTYVGAATINDDTVSVSFSAYAGPDCRLQITLEHLDPKSYVALAATSGKPGQNMTRFSIAGMASDGKRLSSDSAYALSLGSGSLGHFIKLGYQNVLLERDLSEPAPTACLTLWFRSFKSFANSPVATQMGELRVFGDSKECSIDDVSGGVQLCAGSADPGPEWHAQADGLLRHMHRGLGFVHGGRLQAPMLDYVRGDKRAVTFFSGGAFRPEFAVQPSLHHDPIIKALTDRYFLKGDLSDALWSAVGWMQIDTTFDEVRFLTGMTALEMIAENELSDPARHIIPKAQFKALRAALEAAIDSDQSVGEVQKAILRARVGQINGKALTDRIAGLFERYSISKADFEGTVIKQLVDLRNEIVHHGSIPDGVDAWPSIILVRELVTRIVLAEIGFVGKYYCYIGGQHDRDFGIPDTASAGSI